jgi:5'-nucleotidase
VELKTFLHTPVDSWDKKAKLTLTGEWIMSNRTFRRFNLLNSQHLSIVLCLALVSCSTTQKDLNEVDSGIYSQDKVFQTLQDTTTLVLLGTNDVHGALAPEEATTKDAEATPYFKGGVTYFASQIKLLKQQWGNQLLILDGGDQFQGSLDSNLLYGSPITQWMNSIGVTAASIGNHEFDFGAGPTPPNTPNTNDNRGASRDLRAILKKRISEAKFPYLAANIDPPIPGSIPFTILERQGIKIGLFGLTTTDTPQTTRFENVADLKFKELKSTSLKTIAAMKAQGADIIILVTHAGLFCESRSKIGVIKHDYNGYIHSPDSPQGPCSNDEITRLLNELPQGTIDAVVSGHTHSIVHHWINGTPVIQSGTRNQYFHLMYLPIDLKTKKVIHPQVKIEGPIPICPKVFAKQHDCNGDRPAPKNGRGSLVSPQFRGVTVTEDAETNALLAPIFAQTAQLKNQPVITLSHPLDHERKTESPLGNVIADAIRDNLQADVAFVNPGGIRANFKSGLITYNDVFRTLPFDNTVSLLSLNGKELKLLLEIIESGARGFYPTSGLALKVIDTKYEAPARDLDGNGQEETWEIDRLIQAQLATSLQNKNALNEINDHQTYHVATLDFLANGGDGLKWFMNQIPPSRKKIIAGGLVRDVTADYLRRHGSTIHYQPEGRLVLSEPPQKKAAPTKKHLKKSKRKKARP